ncbi:SAM-dependent methyltransferase [Oleiphilus messinensis]|uniref:SAM-dependent methyltransferase n=1 Tax=Oleiphilus messinensis TaxID=141451 RepID=A0A1Y0I652_9GAMM|nr:class I SAM-dependent methyltransferase [Oleiphilus messinensis]ARU55679.1 SAM-dependent methyltransferase [Oleiphilus messinensis]
MDHSIRFWDRIAERYAKKPIADEHSYQQKLRLTQDYLQPDMKVLEYGCGTGSTALIHAPQVTQYTAIDASSKMIAIAKRKQDQSNLDQNVNLEFKVATLNEYKNASGAYDAVLALNILHLLKDWEAAIEQSFKLLKPGGVFISSTACIAEANILMGWVLKYMLPVGHFLRLLPSVEVFSQRKLERSLRETGFQIQHTWSAEKSREVCFIIATKPDTEKNSITGVAE